MKTHNNPQNESRILPDNSNLSGHMVSSGSMVSFRSMVSSGNHCGIKFCVLAAACLCLCCSCSSTSIMLRSPIQIRQQYTEERVDLNSPKPSERSMVILRGLGKDTKINSRRPEAIEAIKPLTIVTDRGDMVFTIAELSYKEGITLESNNDYAAALKYYTQCLTYSWLFLFDARYRSSRNSYDPLFRDLCDLYNNSSDKILRIARTSLNNLDGNRNREAIAYTKSLTLPISNDQGEITINSSLQSLNWTADDIEELRFTKDYNVTGLTNRYRQYGLGVPMMIKRHCNPDDADAQYSPTVQFYPVTALLRPEMTVTNKGVTNKDNTTQGVTTQDVTTQVATIQDATGINISCTSLTLEYYDSTLQNYTIIDNQIVPLESDLSTALAASVNDIQANKIGLVGLIHPGMLLNKKPGQNRTLKGFYLPQPYDPNKIPVIMVHGLLSSPLVWLDMFNSLRSVPELNQRYQFWFYLYPNGQPFWVSAAQMRADMADIRQTLDPSRTNPNFDQLILVGHSMGGLVSRLQTLESDDNLWNLVSSRPLEELALTDQTKNNLRSWFYFHSNPSIRKVILIATPNLGSPMSNSATQNLARAAVHQTHEIKKLLTEIVGLNKKKLTSDFLEDNQNSVDSLEAGNPFFSAMNQCSQSATVTYHTIIGLEPKSFWNSNPDSDGVVKTSSARLDGAESELYVDALHTVITQNPAAIMEVGRILSQNP